MPVRHGGPVRVVIPQLYAWKSAKFIKTIEAALERVENGTYGLCIVCGAPIGEGRLKVVPTAKTCIDHKE